MGMEGIQKELMSAMQQLLILTVIPPPVLHLSRGDTLSPHSSLKQLQGKAN
jgi:hypothetical protein